MGPDKSSDPQYLPVSGRFREAVLARIERLERDANEDARLIPELVSKDHQYRVAQLVAAQIEEAVRLRTRLLFSGATVQFLHDRVH